MGSCDILLITYGMLAYVLQIFQSHCQDFYCLRSHPVYGPDWDQPYDVACPLFSDVMGGFTACTIWLVMCITAVSVLKHRQS